MNETKKSRIDWVSLAVAVIIPLAVGIASSFLSKGGFAKYAEIDKPSFSPPSAVFGIVWPILYILMGISSYIIFKSGSEKRMDALTAYSVSLVFNFLWSIVFFGKEKYLGAFIVLLLLWISIIFTIVLYRRINKTAALLQIPYVLWVTFAGVLNFAVCLLNR